MPPVRKPPRARPQTARCRYVNDRDGEKCRRIATVDGELCRQHAIVIEMELAPGPVASIIGIVDRVLLTNQGQPLAQTFRSIFDGALAGLRRQPPPSRSAPGSRVPPRPTRPPSSSSAAPPPPPRRPDPVARAREVMGFEPEEVLTRERVEARRRDLAKVFHPDRGASGSKEQMVRVNQAADALLAKLS